MHLYIHVPFCARRCTYCDFAIAVRRQVPTRAFVETVRAEWRAWQPSPIWESRGREAGLTTVYLGGGTPSLLDPSGLVELLAELRAERGIAPGSEVTLEANPEDVTPEASDLWVAAGVGRVSLGVQSFDPGVLAWMHRIHDAARPGRAVATLRAAGVANISLDLIYGLPGSLDRDWAADLDRALELEPEHLSLYALTIEHHTPVSRWIERGIHRVPDSERAADEYLAAHQRVAGAGLQFYEVSNAARAGFESRHNQAYWNRASYLGLGPSAHSAAAGRRWWNAPHWEAYRKLVADKGTAVIGEEDLTEDQVRLEATYLGLRTLRGVAASLLPEMPVTEWVAAGWARRDGSRVVLTPEGWLRLDALVTRVVAA